MARHLLVFATLALAVVASALGFHIDQALKDDVADGCDDVMNLLQSRSNNVYAPEGAANRADFDDPALTRMETLGDTYEAIGRALITQEALAATSSLNRASGAEFFATGRRHIGPTQHRKAKVSRVDNSDPMLQEEIALKNEVRQLRSRLLQYMVEQPNVTADEDASTATSNASQGANASDDAPPWMQTLLGHMDEQMNGDMFDIGDKVSKGQLKFIYMFCLALPFTLAASVSIWGFVIGRMDRDGDGHVDAVDAVTERFSRLTTTMANQTERGCDLIFPKWCFDAFCGWCSWRIWLFVFLLVDITTGLAAWALYHDMLQPIAAQIMSYLFIMMIAISILSMALYEAKLRVFEPIFSVIDKLESANGKIQGRIEKVVNQAETLTGLDLDGDGDKGAAGSHHQKRTAEQLEEDKKAKREKRKKRYWCQ